MRLTLTFIGGTLDTIWLSSDGCAGFQSFSTILSDLSLSLPSPPPLRSPSITTHLTAIPPSMDIDLLADIFSDGQPALFDDLLSCLPGGTITNDDSATASISTSDPVKNIQAGAVVSKIEDVFEEVAGCILDEKKKITIKLKTRGKQSATARDTITGAIRSLPDEETKTVQFPSRSSKEAWRFSESSKNTKWLCLTEKQLHYCGFLSCPMKHWSWAFLRPKGLTRSPSICAAFYLNSEGPELLPTFKTLLFHPSEMSNYILTSVQGHVLSRSRALHEANCCRPLR